MILLLVFLLCFTQLANQQLPPRLQARANRENPVIPNRLLNPSMDESIVHVIMNPFAPDRKGDVMSNWTERRVNEYPDDKQWARNRTDLVELCGVPELFRGLPDFFPRFLCGLISVYQEVNITSLPYTRDLFSRPSSAVRFMNDPANYPCHELNLTDVVAFAPNRIYSSCMNESDPSKYSQFDQAHVMTHPFPEVPICNENETKTPKCEMRSMIVQHKVVYQQRSCCCDNSTCGVLVFSQKKSLTPVILTTIDLAAIPPKPTTAKPTMDPQLLMRMLNITLPPTNSSRKPFWWQGLQNFTNSPVSLNSSTTVSPIPSISPTSPINSS